MRKIIKHILLVSCLLMLILTSCKKLVTVDDPINTISAGKMFRNEAQAENALAGVYNSLIHGSGTAQPEHSAKNIFAAGLATYAGALSSGELLIPAEVPGSNDWELYTSKVTTLKSELCTKIWNSAYNTIYLANTVIEGASAVTATTMRDSVRAQFIAEAKFMRAFSYFYLVNYFGEVPLALTVDFNQTAHLSRSAISKVYAQVERDLLDAYDVLPKNYLAATGEKRIRVNHWAAAAMLARLYLYTGENEKAAVMASHVIEQTSLFRLEPLADVFLTTSHEAIFQLMQTNEGIVFLKNATTEGYLFIPDKDKYRGNARVYLSPELLNSFEDGDQRRKGWIDSTMQNYYNPPQSKVWYPAKYKVGAPNSVAGAPQEEFQMVLRLGEMYLIRAEARANGADGGTSKAVEDLNAIRYRASLPLLPVDLNATAVKAAVEKERQTELFAEWGHRWFDLKRTGRASAVISVLPGKQPWEGDYQLMYPIPVSEIIANRMLVQNFGY